MDNAIGEQDDSKAIRLLAAVSKSEYDAGMIPGDIPTLHAFEWPDRETVRVGDRVTEGDLACAALLWLAESPRERQIVEDMITQEPPAHYGIGMGIGAIVAVLPILKAKGLVEYKDGRWHSKIELTEMKERPLKSVLNLLGRLNANS